MGPERKESYKKKRYPEHTHFSVFMYLTLTILQAPHPIPQSWGVWSQSVHGGILQYISINGFRNGVWSSWGSGRDDNETCPIPLEEQVRKMVRATGSSLLCKKKEAGRGTKIEDCPTDTMEKTGARTSTRWASEHLWNMLSCFCSQHSPSQSPHKIHYILQKEALSFGIYIRCTGSAVELSCRNDRGSSACWGQAGNANMSRSPRVEVRSEPW